MLLSPGLEPASLEGQCAEELTRNDRRTTLLRRFRHFRGVSNAITLHTKIYEHYCEPFYFNKNKTLKKRKMQEIEEKCVEKSCQKECS